MRCMNHVLRTHSILQLFCCVLVRPSVSVFVCVCVRWSPRQRSAHTDGQPTGRQRGYWFTWRACDRRCNIATRIVGGLSTALITHRTVSNQNTARRTAMEAPRTGLSPCNCRLTVPGAMANLSHSASQELRYCFPMYTSESQEKSQKENRLPFCQILFIKIKKLSWY